MAAIVKRDRLGGSTSYFVVYRDGSGRKRWEQFEREKPAKARKAQVELEMARTGGRWVPPVPVLFDKYAQEWLDGYAARAVRPRVLENYRRELRRARKAFGTLELAAVTRTHVKTLLAERAAAGAAANTLRNALIPLRECLAHAVDGGLIPSNPAARVPIPAAHKRKIVPPTRAQVEALILKAREDAAEALTLAAALGLRRGELFALRWSDVELQGGARAGPRDERAGRHHGDHEERGGGEGGAAVRVSEAGVPGPSASTRPAALPAGRPGVRDRCRNTTRSRQLRAAGV